MFGDGGSAPSFAPLPRRTHKGSFVLYRRIDKNVKNPYYTGHLYNILFSLSNLYGNAQKNAEQNESRLESTEGYSRQKEAETY